MHGPSFPVPAGPSENRRSSLSRREFLRGSALLAASVALPGCRTGLLAGPEPIIDIHQHVGYAGRPNDVLLAHQREMGVTRTILLPAGRPVSCPATHEGKSNGLQAMCLGNDACRQLALAHSRYYFFAGNEVPGQPYTLQEIEKYLKLGAVAVAEQKFGVECDATAMQEIYRLAADYGVPVLMHWQHGMYNYGFERFYRMLEAHPKTLFIGHAQTWWANIGKDLKDQTVLYPKGKVAPGGLTDRYLSDYENMYGDLSAGSGLNALTRDESHAREFLRRHQDKLLYGSDCNDRIGSGAACQGAQTIAAVRRLAVSDEVRRKIFSRNAERVFRLAA